MRASATEYRLRGLVIAVIFFAGFQCWRVDHVALADALGGVLHVPARAVVWAGAVVGLLGAWVRTWATAYLDKDVVHAAVVRSDSVVADGPYRYVRNPLYVAIMLLAVGYAATATRVGAAVMLVGIPLFLFRLVLGEEAALRASQGERYEAFLRAVPRFVPSLTPRAPASGRAPGWKRAWQGEEMFWCFGLGLVAHAVTGDWTIAGVLAAVGVALRVVERARSRAK